MNSTEQVTTNRVVSVDVYRGWVMLLMMAEVLRLEEVSNAIPRSAFWRFLAFHQSHVSWTGCSLHDLIQPSFTFLVGVAVPFSIAARVARGQSKSGMTWHAIRRALILIFLGIFLRSMHSEMTNFTFEDTLTQIGLGYPLLFLLGFKSPRFIIWTVCALLIIYWALFAFYPLPGADFDWASAGIFHESQVLRGFAGHWSMNVNLASAFDQWFLNLFPREERFINNGGGYVTLSFIPTLATMALGLIAGNLLRKISGSSFVRLCIQVGVALVLVALLLHFTGICPIVKKIWTPAWVLFSGGCCFLILAMFYQLIDIWGAKKVFFPLLIIGSNSIAAYVLAHTLGNFINSSLRIHLGAGYDQWLGPAFTPLLAGAFQLLVLWLVLYWMYRKKIFIKI